MSASSVTGVGAGEAGKHTTRELSILSNAPSIYLVGAVASTEIAPGVYGGTVLLPTPLPGVAEDYVVILTTLRAGWAQIQALDGTPTEFTSFDFRTDNESDEVMYIVAKRGVRPLNLD